MTEQHTERELSQDEQTKIHRHFVRYGKIINNCFIFAIVIFVLSFSVPFFVEKISSIVESSKIAVVNKKQRSLIKIYIQLTLGILTSSSSLLGIALLLYVDNNKDLINLVSNSRKKLTVLKATSEYQLQEQEVIKGHERSLNDLENKYCEDEDEEDDSDQQDFIPPSHPTISKSPVSGASFSEECLPLNPSRSAFGVPVVSYHQNDVLPEENQNEEDEDWSQNLRPIELTVTPQQQLSEAAKIVGKDIETFICPKSSVKWKHWFFVSPTRCGKTFTIFAFIVAWWISFQGKIKILVIDPKNEKTGWGGLEYIQNVLSCPFETDVQVILDWVDNVFKEMELRNKNSGVRKDRLFLVLDEFSMIIERFKNYDRVNKTKLKDSLISKILTIATSGAGVGVHLFIVGHSFAMTETFGKDVSTSKRDQFTMVAVGRYHYTEDDDPTEDFAGVSSLINSTTIIKDQNLRATVKQRVANTKAKLLQDQISTPMLVASDGSVFIIPNLSHIKPTLDSEGFLILDEKERPSNFYVLKGLEQFEPTLWKNGKPVFKKDKQPNVISSKPATVTSASNLSLPPLLVPEHHIEFWKVVEARKNNQSLTEFIGKRVDVKKHDFNFPIISDPQMNNQLWFELIRLIRKGTITQKTVIKEVFDVDFDENNQNHLKYDSIYKIASQYVLSFETQRYGKGWTTLSYNAKKTIDSCVCCNCNKKSEETHHAVYTDKNGNFLGDNLDLGVHIFPLCTQHHREFHDHHNSSKWVFDPVNAAKFNHQQIEAYITLCHGFDEKIAEISRLERESQEFSSSMIMM